MRPGLDDRGSSHSITFAEALFPFLSSRAASIGRSSVVGCSIVLATRVGHEIHTRRICRVPQPARRLYRDPLRPRPVLLPVTTGRGPRKTTPVFRERALVRDLKVLLVTSRAGERRFGWRFRKLCSGRTGQWAVGESPFPDRVWDLHLGHGGHKRGHAVARTRLLDTSLLAEVGMPVCCAGGGLLQIRCSRRCNSDPPAG